jgi:hypothetical protein
MERPGPTSGLRLFEVVASDGRSVRLHEEWFHEHVLGRKREIAQLQNPVQEIERALTHAVLVKPSSVHPSRQIYVGPAIGHGFFRDDCLEVVVQPTGQTHGFVITVVMRKALAG